MAPEQAQPLGGDCGKTNSEVVVVIPAYNAASHIDGVLQRLDGVAALSVRKVIVVDDGSTDATRERVRAWEERGAGRNETGLAKEPGLARATSRAPLTVELIVRAKNGGYGAAMKDGLERARAWSPDIVACLHADGQYSPEALPALIQALEARKLDVLQGSRIASGTALSGGMPLYKYVANAALNVLENSTFHLAMTDYHSGYLLYGRRAVYGLRFERFSNSFDFDLEVIAAATAGGLSVGEAPVPTHYGDEVSHLNPMTYGLRVLRVLWNYLRGRYDANATT